MVNTIIEVIKMRKKHPLLERDPYSINPSRKAVPNVNLARNTCIRADLNYNYELSKEIFLIEPHYNDLYVQN